jgi:hypothetical protein
VTFVEKLEVRLLDHSVTPQLLMEVGHESRLADGMSTGQSDPHEGKKRDLGLTP